MNKGLTIKTGQTHVQAYTQPLLKLIQAGDIDPSFTRIRRASKTRRPCTRSFATRKTESLRLSCARVDSSRQRDVTRNVLLFFKPVGLSWIAHALGPDHGGSTFRVRNTALLNPSDWMTPLRSRKRFRLGTTQRQSCLVPNNLTRRLLWLEIKN